MPKKNKGGSGGSGGGGAAKLQEEMMELKQQLEDIQNERKEQQKAVDRLTRENMSKINQVNMLEELLKTNEEKHIEELKCVQNEAVTEREEARAKIEMLDHEVRTLQRHLEAYEVMERENSSLRERVGTLLVNLEEEGMEHAGITHKMKKEMFNLRMQLEQTFRKTLQELDGQYQKKAFDAMNVESKNALTANAKLKEELALQSVGVENLLQRYKKQEEQFLKLKIEKSMLAKTSHLQLNQIASLKRQHYEYEARVSDMQYSMRRMNAERLSKEEELEEVPKLLDEIEQYKSLYEKSAGDVETWKAKAAQGSTAHSDFEKRAKAMEYLHKRMQLSGSMEFLPLSDPLAASFDASSFVPAVATTPVEVDVSHMWSSKFPVNPAKSVLRKSKSANAKLKPIHPSASAPRLHASEDRFNFF